MTIPVFRTVAFTKFVGCLPACQCCTNLVLPPFISTSLGLFCSLRFSLFQTFFLHNLAPFHFLVVSLKFSFRFSPILKTFSHGRDFSSVVFISIMHITRALCTGLQDGLHFMRCILPIHSPLLSFLHFVRVVCAVRQSICTRLAKCAFSSNIVSGDVRTLVRDFPFTESNTALRSWCVLRAGCANILEHCTWALDAGPSGRVPPARYKHFASWNRNVMPQRIFSRKPVYIRMQYAEHMLFANTVLVQTPAPLNITRSPLTPRAAPSFGS